MQLVIRARLKYTLAEYNLVPILHGTASRLILRRNSLFKKSLSEKCAEHNTLHFDGFFTVPVATEIAFSH